MNYLKSSHAISRFLKPSAFPLRQLGLKPKFITVARSSFTTSSAKTNRPLSPHLQIYQWQLTWVLSITHRITGAAIAAGAYGAGICYALAPFQAASVTAAAAAIPGILFFAGKFLIAAPFSYHFFNGLRHLLWDIRLALTLNEVYYTGYAVSGATLLSSIYLAAL